MGASIATRMASLAAGARTGLLVFLGAVSLYAVTMDLATPCPGRCASLLDELLEATEISLNPGVVSPECITDALGHVLRIPVHLELDLRLARAERHEPHDAFVTRAGRAPPHDDLVRDLFGDLGVPLFDPAANSRAPMQALVVELLNFFDAIHESRELLELGPLVVPDPDRDVYIYGFLDCRHVYDSSASLLWIRRLLALPFCFAAFSSSRFIASRDERVGGWPARLRGTERDLIDRLVGARAVPSEWWRILPAVTSDRSVVLYGYMEASSSMTLPAREGAGVPDGAGRVADSLSPAFESLFRTEYARVVGIAHRVLADQAEAEDVAQDVFVSFYRSRSEERRV